MHMKWVEKVGDKEREICRDDADDDGCRVNCSIVSFKSFLTYVVSISARIYLSFSALSLKFIRRLMIDCGYSVGRRTSRASWRPWQLLQTPGCPTLLWVGVFSFFFSYLRIPSFNSKVSITNYTYIALMYTHRHLVTIFFALSPQSIVFQWSITRRNIMGS